MGVGILRYVGMSGNGRYDRSVILAREDLHSVDHSVGGDRRRLALACLRAGSRLR